MTSLRRLLLALLALGLVLASARLVAPHFVLAYVNRTLNGLDGYSVSVADVDLHIWRGAYEIEGVHIEKAGQRRSIPVLEVERIDISVHWDALLDGSIVGEIELHAPKLNFVAERAAEPRQEQRAEQRDKQRAAQGESTWQTQAKELVPLKINRVGIYGGEIHYRDPHTAPAVDIFVQDLSGELTNLTNSEDLAEDLVAHASFRGRAQQSGRFRLDASVDPYETSPTFRLAAELEGLRVAQLNQFLKAYANVDAEDGTISVYTEVSAERGRFRGYVKPLIRDLRVIRWKDEKEGFFGKLWEALVEGASELFENHPKEQIATRIPFSGRLADPRADVASTVLTILSNAFIEALERGLDSQLGSEHHLSASSSSSGD